MSSIDSIEWSDVDMPNQVRQIEFPIEWYVPDSIKSQYATNMVVQHTEQEFILSFFETRPPLLLGNLTEEDIKAIPSIRAECVARIVIARDRMPKFVEALQTNLKTSRVEPAPSDSD
jgi:uncharacterized protein DUF3467